MINICFKGNQEYSLAIVEVLESLGGESHDSVGGTSREWSNYSGPNDSGVWDNFYDARENVILVNLEIIEKKQNGK